MAEPHPRVVDLGHPLVSRVRSLCLALPEAVEIESRGRPHWRAGRSPFFAFVGARMGLPFTVCVKLDPEEQLAWEDDPRFFVPPYWGPYGWRALHLDAADTDWQLIAELLDGSYRQVANKRQLKALDSRSL